MSNNIVPQRQIFKRKKTKNKKTYAFSVCSPKNEEKAPKISKNRIQSFKNIDYC